MTPPLTDARVFKAITIILTDLDGDVYRIPALELLTLGSSRDWSFKSAVFSAKVVRASGAVGTEESETLPGPPVGFLSMSSSLLHLGMLQFALHLTLHLYNNQQECLA